MVARLMFDCFVPSLNWLNALNPKASVVINPHTESSTESLVRVMDSASQADILDVEFVHRALQ